MDAQQSDKGIEVQNLADHESGLTVYQFTSLILRSWKFLAVSILTAIIFAILVLQLSTPKYTISMVVSEPPVSIENQAMESDFAAGLLRGFGSSSPKLSRFIALLSTRRLSNVLSQDDDLMAFIFSQEWDSSLGAWRKPSESLVANLLNIVHTVLGRPKSEWQPPDAARLARYLDENLEVSRDRASGMAAIKLNFVEPEQGVIILTQLYQNAEEILRYEVIDYHQVVVADINSKLAEVTISDYRTKLLDILAESEKKIMLLNSNLPYVADLFQPPIASTRPTTPNTLLTLVFGAFAGLLGGIIYITIKHHYPKQNRSIQ